MIPKIKIQILDTFQAMLFLLFVQHNILPRGGHKSEPSYMDLWLVDSILCGRKVNLGFLIIQHMANGLSSVNSVILYGMLLTTIFCHFDLDLDGESDIRVCKPSETIDIGSISRLRYELHGHKWVLKITHVPATAEEESDEEAVENIPSPSPTAAPSPPPLTVGVGSSSIPVD